MSWQTKANAIESDPSRKAKGLARWRSTGEKTVPPSGSLIKFAGVSR